MKPQFIVLSKGKIFSAEDYLSHASKEVAYMIKYQKGDVSLPKKKESAYLAYANKFGFSWESHADIGFMNMDYKANLMHRLVKVYARNMVEKIGIPLFEISGSRMFDMSHPVVKSYASLYGERLFHPSVGDKSMVMGYDCSYPQFNLASKYHMSYKQLPFAHFSLNECFRLEQSGECMLFYRGRQFNMPDLHPYCKDINEAFDVYRHIQQQVLQVFADAKRSILVSLIVSSKKYWDKYQEELMKLSREADFDMLVEIPEKDRQAYWIMNADFNIIDKLGHVREIACIQIDIKNAERLGIAYVDNAGKKHYPVIIHSAVSGGIERYLYMLFDNFEQFFPLWLYPVQMRLIPVNDSYSGLCEQIEKRYHNNIRIDIDDRSESVSKRIKQAKEVFIPHAVVIGQKEVDNNAKDVHALCKQIRKEIADKPFLQRSYPAMLSKQLS